MKRLTMATGLFLLLASSLLGSDTPIGEIMLWGSLKVPAGYLPCDGRELKCCDQKYEKLYKAIGNTYGGISNDTFYLPDTRGMFIRGWNQDGSVDAGRALATMQGDAIRNISGYFGGCTDSYGYTGGAFKVGYSTSSKSGSGDKYNYRINFDASNVVPTANENRPKNIALIYLIKYQDVPDKDKYEDTLPPLGNK